MTTEHVYWGSKGAGAIIYSTVEQKFLFGLRSDGVMEPGTVGVFGGRIEEGDSVRETVENEIMEETGYFYPPSKLIPLVVYRDNNFEYFNHIAIIDQDFEPELNWEHDGLMWMSLDQVMAMQPDERHYGLNVVLSDPESLKRLQMVEAHKTIQVDPDIDYAAN
jgi:8-oxo-dGTP pyrophosphatase MutT (NUDIX family)